MKTITTLSVWFLAMLITVPGISFAAESDKPLRGTDIEGFMAAMKPLQNLAEKHDLEEEKNPASLQDMPQGDFAPMTHSLKKIRDHAAYGEFKSIIRNAGFSSPEQWANVGDRIMKAYISLNIAEQSTPEQRQELRKSLAEIEQNQYLSDPMKKKLRANLEQALTMMEGLSNSTQADQDVLKPYIPQLERKFKELE